MNAEYPWDHEGMIFIEGRYYSRLWNLPIPKHDNFPLGGDILILLWRYDASPVEWVITGRFRRNFDEKIFDSNDEKKWFAMEFQGTENEVSVIVGNVLTQMAGTIGLQILKSTKDHEVIAINGDCNKAFEILRTTKCGWIHMQK